MRTKTVWLTAILIVSMGFGLSQGQEVVNLLENGGFETGDMAPWSTYGPGTSEVVTELTGAAVPEAASPSPTSTTAPPNSTDSMTS